jgi:hypothetical protein
MNHIISETDFNPTDGIIRHAELLAESSPESVIIDALEKAERCKNRLTLAKKVIGKLTYVKCRRYLPRRVYGLAISEIAEWERISRDAVVYSLAQAEKRIKKSFGRSLKSIYQNRIKFTLDEWKFCFHSPRLDKYRRSRRLYPELRVR